MDNRYIKRFLFLAVLFLFVSAGTFAQTLTVGSVDAGPYGPGSTIAVPLSINDASGCISQANTFNLYLSDASGNFVAGGKLIGSFTGFYASFLNGVIPAATPAGAGYKVIIKSTNPIVTSAPTAAFAINAAAAVSAGASSQFINATYPEVYGQCNGSPGAAFIFTNSSTAGTTVTASFFNELTQAYEGTNVAIPAAGYTFTANTANYTVTVKAKAADGTIGTHAYQLINNVINTSIGSTGNPSVCLVNGKGDLTFNIDISSPTGIQFNYPGNTYTFTWGDGSPASTYDLCEIKALNGQITHTFTKPSCGTVSNGHVNHFEIDFQPNNVYCGKIGSAPSNYANIMIPPTNKFSAPTAACAGTAVTFINVSSPGPDANSTVSSCANNANALYSWLLDGVTVAPNYVLDQNFVLPATTPAGSHIVTLHLQNSNGCAAVDYAQTICIQNPPQPIFTLPATTCRSAGAVTPVNTSIIDANCNAANQYVWTVTGSTAVTYAGGTNANSAQPQFVFGSAGSYTVQLSITTTTCGLVAGPTKTITVNDSPVTTLSPDVSLCGNAQTFTFDNNPGPTQTILTGTSTPLANTYTWTVTGGAYAYQNGTNSNSKYPQILFNDFATYSVNVVQQNNCGSTQATQKITFQQAPTVVAGTTQSICASNPTAPLNGKITGTINSFAWVGGTGTFTAGRNSLTGNYIPSAAEINAGQVTLTLQATTALSAPCNVISSNMVINITPVDNVISTPAITICTGQPVNYTILASDPTSTFTWTASVTSGTATGVAANGSGTAINDIINNTSTNANAIVTYVITPKGNSCSGTPFKLNVTVIPLPVITAAPVSSPICSNQPANIVLKSNIVNTSYTWTSTASAGVTGNTNQANAVTTNSIQDILINNGIAPATVTYVITPLNGTCPGTPETASVIVQPLPVQSLPGPDDEVCNTPTYTLKGNNPAPGTGKWTLVSGQSGITFSDDTNPNAIVSGLIAGNVYQFKWTITATPTCPPNSNAVTITIDNPTIGGTTTGGTAVCSGSSSGEIDLTGQSGNILRWESSTDNGSTWLPIANITAKQTYSNLTQTTQYRAITQSGICSALPSTVTTITVNQPVPLAQVTPIPALCNQTTVTLVGNDPAPYNGTWTQTAGPAATIVNPASYQTLVTGLASGNAYTFLWTIKGVAPCADSSAPINISVAQDITPKFTVDKTQGCGPTTIIFTNTSTPNTAGTFEWDFGDGSAIVTAVTPPPHTFLPSADGKDKKYTISLTPVSNCLLKTPFTMDVIISPALPVATIIPSQTSACGAFTLTLQNTSPGNNVSYDYYVLDPQNIVLQHVQYPDKRDVTFIPIDPTKEGKYTVYVIATDQCGNTNPSTAIIITAGPSGLTSLMQLKGAQQSICLGNSVIFQNISSGGDRFNYSIYDASSNKLLATIPAGAGDLTYTPKAAGDYYVTITAGTTGCGDAAPSPQTDFTVYPDPQPNFTYTGDNDYNVTFTNTTADNGNTPAASLSYTWDFGDGSSPENTITPNAHHYDYTKSPFTVTLTASNAASNCLGVKKETVIVKFLGGLYLPNAFIPASTDRELNTFIAKGTALREWSMQIFNNFGQLLWSTTKLDSNGSPAEGWDGTFKGAPVQQGVYVWQISATFADGSKWKGMSYNNSLPKRTGIINLIR